MSELALKLIAENKKTRSPFLDLGNCGLTEVPQEIGKLVWLEELSFSSKWRYLDIKKGWTKKTQNTGPQNNIARLYLWRRKSLFGGKPAKFSPFSGLIKMKKLYLSGDWDGPMTFNDLSPLSNLSNLQELEISGYQLKPGH